jgi:TonB family protein
VTPARQRIVDVVFESERAPRRHGALVGLAFGASVHGVVLLAAWRGGPSLEAWAAEVAVRVHAELSRTEVVELPEEPARPDVAPAPPTTRNAPAFDVSPSGARATHAHRATALHPDTGAPPAEAGRVLAADDAGPADLTAETFVVGDGAGYAGGATRSDGTGKDAVDAADVARGPGGAAAPGVSGPAPARPATNASRSVRAESAWACAWPREADGEAIDTQSATVRITVGADGRLESASIEADPGYGFGRAALECARAMRYAPALDASGTPMRATTSVRVRFWR